MPTTETCDFWPQITEYVVFLGEVPLFFKVLRSLSSIRDASIPPARRWSPWPCCWVRSGVGCVPYLPHHCLWIAFHLSQTLQSCPLLSGTLQLILLQLHSSLTCIKHRLAFLLRGSIHVFEIVLKSSLNLSFLICKIATYQYPNGSKYFLSFPFSLLLYQFFPLLE